MDPKDQEKIKRTIVELKQDLMPEHILDHLLQSGTIHPSDQERILYEPTTAGKTRVLTQILYSKHGSYRPFYKALCDNGFKHLANKLEPPGEDNLNNPVACLHSSFEKCSGSKVTLEEIKTVLQCECGEECDLSRIQKLLRQAFEHIEFKKNAKVKKNTDRLQKWFAVNIRKRDGIKVHTSGVSARASAIASSHTCAANITYTSETPSYQTLTSGELYVYLKNWTEEQGIERASLDVVKKEKIDGQVFHAMTQEEINELFQSVPFGDRKKLYLLSKKENQPVITNNLEQIAVVEEEFLAEFNRATKLTTSYKQHAIVRDKATSLTNLIDRVNQFVAAQDVTGEDLCKQIAKDSVRFAAACMNSRTNGTIHFGIMDDGQIMGVELDREKCNTELNQLLRASFFDDQHMMVERCMRPARFVEVIQTNDSHLYVVEVDVVSLSSVVGEDAFFLKQPAGFRQTYQKLYVFEREGIRDLRGDDMRKFMEMKSRLSEQRRQQEDQYISARAKAHLPDLGEKFAQLLCGGSDTLESSMFPMLVCGKPDEKSRLGITEENFDFLKRIDWEIVMDLDDNASEYSLYGLYEDKFDKATRTLTAEEFDPRSSSDNNDRLEKIANSSLLPWMFLNGYSVQESRALDPPEWKENRFTSIKEVMKFFYTENPEGRAVVVILLLSKNYGVLADIIADEICTRFQDQWIAVAEDSKVADPLKEELIRRNVRRSAVEGRFIVGIPWKHISELIKKLKGPSDESSCLLPTSTGACCLLKEKVRTSLTDIDILTMNQCEKTEFQENPEKLRQKENQEEVRFYKGHEVSWWNFWFKNHVCRRREHTKLSKQVKESLEGDIKGDRVGRVHLYHQPGAGCTTMSKHVLWEHRSFYRCCVIRQITDQTCEQIEKLYTFEEDEAPRPVLALIDNIEEERVDQLYAELEECARQLAKDSRTFDAFCVLLICSRRMKGEANYHHKRVWLTHSLNPEELLWFKEKNETLEKHHQENRGVDPTTLIAFNILKENFNPNYIQRTVKEILQTITVVCERTLLKFVSLINSFDIYFKPVPLACFDPIMLPNQRKLGMNNRWETQLSSSIKVFLNQRPTQGFRGKCQGVRVSNALLSREILNQLLSSKEGPGLQTVADAMLELLHSRILKSRNKSRKELLSIIKIVIKKRPWTQRGKTTKFSPLIEEIRETESTEIAAQVMDTVFEQTEDAFVAQQIARLYIEAENWVKACEYANICTRKLPQNSFLWDTYGQVYKRKLKAICDKNRTEGNCAHQCSVEEIQAIQDGFEAIDMYRKEQGVSRNERAMEVLNTAGYFGEVQTTILLLELLRFLIPFDAKETLHNFMVMPGFYPPQAMELFGQNICKRLKSLYKDSSDALAFLEEDFLHLKDNTFNDDRKSFQHNNKDKLVVLTEHHLNFFGEDENAIPTQFTSSQDSAAYRRRRVLRLVGGYLGAILDTRFKEDGVTALQQAYELLHENIDSNQANVFDYKSVFGVLLTLSLTSSLERSSLLNIIHYSQLMFEMVGDEDERVELEAYLFFVMFNWPMGDDYDKSRTNCTQLTSAIQKWRHAFLRKHPLQREGRPVKRKETTIFHLGNGEGLKQYAHFSELHGGHGNRKIKGENFWTSSETVRRLRILEGTLLKDGLEVQTRVRSSEGNISTLTIASVRPIVDRSQSNKRVFFSVGFSWSGPKAYFISREDPRNIVFPEPKPAAHISHKKRQPLRHYQQLMGERDKIQALLTLINHLKRKKSVEKWLPQHEWNLVRNERQTWEQFQKLQNELDEPFEETQLSYASP